MLQILIAITLFAWILWIIAGILGYLTLSETLRTLSILSFLTALGLSILLGCFIRPGDNSEGYRIGLPYKCSYKGWIWKTWECEMVLRGMYAIAPTEYEKVPRGFQFSICKDKFNQTILDKLMYAMDNSCEIKLKYYSPLIYYIWNQKTKYCAVDVKILRCNVSYR